MTARKVPGGLRITVTISEVDVPYLRALLDVNRDVEHASHGTLTLEKLAAMLLEDAVLVVRRPRSWEGANMATVLQSHGYDV